ncbi:MAG: hypothetical protein H6907_03840 [Hyphomicrobiales bacterium]|nr:hypothetical protein [Hyphomicrobiales bacterium]
MLKTVTMRVRSGRNSPVSEEFQTIAEAHGALLRGGERWDGKTHTFRDMLYYAPPDEVDGLIADLRRRNDVVRAEAVEAPADPQALSERRSGMDRRAKPRPRGADRRGKG